MRVDQAVAWAETLLAEAGIDGPRLDARLLVGHVLGFAPLQILSRSDQVLTLAQRDDLAHLVELRAQRRPMSHILGKRGFWTLDLAVTPDTLDPRPDTECLIQAVLDRIDDRQAPLRLVDFGTGTGAILLALLSELPNAQGVGVDISPAALDVARRNAQTNDLHGRASFCQGNWAEGLDGPFDVALSNPPYIPDGDIDGLEPEVARFEPRLALAGGADGLDCYRLLVPQMARIMVPGGLVGVELGAGQDQDVADLLTQGGFDQVSRHRDLGGIIRAVLAKRKE